MGSREYEATALATARKDGLTAEQAEALSHQEIAAISGVAVVKAASPADFFSANVRAHVANHLRREEEKAAEAAMDASVRDKLSVEQIAWFDEKLANTG